MIATATLETSLARSIALATTAKAQERAEIIRALRAAGHHEAAELVTRRDGR